MPRRAVRFAKGSYYHIYNRLVASPADWRYSNAAPLELNILVAAWQPNRADLSGGGVGSDRPVVAPDPKGG
jgi:hypothetical protein